MVWDLRKKKGIVQHRFGSMSKKKRKNKKFNIVKIIKKQAREEVSVLPVKVFKDKKKYTRKKKHKTEEN